MAVEIEIGGAAPAAPAPAAPKLREGWFQIEVDGKIIVASENLSVLEEMRVSDAISTSHQSNPTWITWADLACNVRSIDGDPVPLPSAESEIIAIIQRVGDSGMRELLGRKTLRMNTALEELKARAKNAQGTTDFAKP